MDSIRCSSHSPATVMGQYQIVEFYQDFIKLISKLLPSLLCFVIQTSPTSQFKKTKTKLVFLFNFIQFHCFGFFFFQSIYLFVSNLSLRKVGFLCFLLPFKSKQLWILFNFSCKYTILGHF